jgi:hypothetical protein
MPLARSSKGVQNLLLRAPTPGAAGLVADIWRLAIGKRHACSCRFG